MAGVLALALWVALAQVPPTAYAQEMEDKSGGLVFYSQEMQPQTEQHYRAGAGTIVWKPRVENGAVVSAEIVLTNAVINNRTEPGNQRANGIDVCVPLTITLNGTNSITTKAMGINLGGLSGANSRPIDLTIRGPGSLDINSELDGISVEQGLTVTNNAHIRVSFGGGTYNNVRQCGIVTGGVPGTKYALNITGGSTVEVRNRTVSSTCQFVYGIQNVKQGTTIQVQGDSNLIVRNDYGSAICAESGTINFENSNIWLSGAAGEETLDNVYTKVNINGGKLYMTNPTSSMAMSASGTVTVFGNARVYESGAGVRNYKIQAGENGGVWYIGSGYTQENINGVRPGATAYVLGNVQWDDNIMGTTTEKMVVGDICESNLTLAKSATIPAGKTLEVKSKGKLTIEQNGWLHVYGTFRVTAAGELECNGKISDHNGVNCDIENDDQKLKQTQTPPKPQINPDYPQGPNTIRLLNDGTLGLQYGWQKEGSSDITWQNERIFNGLEPGTKYTFYTKYAKTWLYQASNESEGTVAYTAYAKPTQLKIDCQNEKITNSDPNAYYSIKFGASPIEIQADENGEIALAEINEKLGWDCISTFLRVYNITRINKTDKDIPNSEETTIGIPGRPDVSKSLTVTPTSFKGETDGGVTGLLSGKTYQYRTQGASDTSWQELTESTQLAAGTYDVRILATANSFASETAQIEIPEGPEKTYEITLTPESLDFGSAEYAYAEAPEAQQVTITNTGNQTITIALPENAPANYTIQPVQGFSDNQATIAPESTAVFSVRPNVGIGTGTYTGTITVTDVVSEGEEHRINKTVSLTFTVQDQQTVATPVIAADREDIIDSLTVTITCATPGASIYYTVDGTEPNEQSARYTAPLTLTDVATVKAIAVKTNWNNSTVASKAFTKHAHNYQTVTHAPTCTEAGEETQTCAGCGDVQKKTIPALNHSYGEWSETKAATCTEDGEKTQTCARCGDVQKQVIPALNHSYGEWSERKAATCTEDGEETQTCARCGDIQKKLLPAKGHNYDGGVVTKDPTTTEAGERTYTCTVCGDTYIESIPKLPEEHQHTYGEWTVTKQPTCTEVGEQTRTCTAGDDTQTQTIPALGHSYDGGVVTRQPTTTQEGERTYTCTRCGNTRTEAIPKRESPSGPPTPGEQRPTKPTTNPPPPPTVSNKPQRLG